MQWDYFRLAESHPRVVGLLAFGFWTSGHDSSDLPLTVAAHRQIAARILRAPASPAGAARAHGIEPGGPMPAPLLRVGPRHIG